MKGFSTTPPPPEDTLWGLDSWTPSRRTSSDRAPEEFARTADAFLLPENVRPRCAASGCDAALKFWKRSARPVFEGQWACSDRCARTLIARSVRRQSVGISTFDGAITSHKHRIPLGLMLLDSGVVTQYQLRQALDAQRAANHGRIGDWLEDLCGVPPAMITRAVAAQWNRPVLSTVGFVADRMASVMPMALRKEASMLPLRLAAGKILYVAFVDDVDTAEVHALERMTGLRIESGLMTQREFRAAESQLDAAQSTVCYREEALSSDALCERVAEWLRNEQPVASQMISVRGGWWLRMWLERAACGPYGKLPATGEDVVDVLFQK